MHPPYDFHGPFAIIRAGFSCLIPLLWLGLSIAALFMLRKRRLGDTARALWAILIVLVPVLGAIAFWIVSPNDEGGVG